MEKDVLITIGGLLYTGNPEEGKDNVDVIAPGQYYEKNEKHYLVYEEVVEDFADPIQNLIRISPEEVLVRKKGIINTELVFRPSEDTTSHYSTPFGSLVMGIHTKGIEIRETEESLETYVEYDLEINYEHVSECFIRILVQPRNENGGFSLY